MKYRLGFVSNSSSSSFVCDICGYTDSGFDLDLKEVEMVECENGHCICKEHLPELTQELIKQTFGYICKTNNAKQEDIDCFLKERSISLGDITFEDIVELSENIGVGFSIIYCLPEFLCPLCSFSELSTDDAMEYLLKTTPYTENEVFEYIKSINKRRKKLTSVEYVEYVLKKLDINTTILLKELDEKFNGSYSKFKKFIK